MLENTKNSPRYSIITVCLNDKEGLQRTLHSIEEQTFKNFEWIVVDGNSTDGTAEIFSGNPIVKKFITEPDRGIYDAMNKGIKLSCGDYLLFLNSGDQLRNKETLFECEKYLVSDLVIGTQIVIKYKKESKENILKNYNRYSIGKKYIYLNTIPHQSTFIKKSLFFKYGMYDDNFKIKGDHDFFARLIVKNVSFSFSPVCVSVYHLNGLSHRLKKESIFKKELELVRKKNFSYFFRMRMKLFELMTKW